MVYRVCVEKKPGLAPECASLLSDCRSFLDLEGLERVRIWNRYDAEGMDKDLFDYACTTVFSEPQLDLTSEETDVSGAAAVFAVEPLPGQFDQRADSAAQCIQLLSQGERPRIRTAKVYALYGTLTDKDVEAVKRYVINPVESREATLAKPETLAENLSDPKSVASVEDFITMDDAALSALLSSMGLAMDLDDLKTLQAYFREEEHRDPTVTEVRVVDTYWSDHCRHTTFSTHLDEITIDDPAVKGAYERYLAAREEVYGAEKAAKRPQTLMDIATIGTKTLKKRSLLPELDESEEINACSIHVPAKVNGEEQDWLLMFKNETHNHPTEIEPFGGAATCIGGCIRDPLSGRAYVHQAMRVTGGGDPRKTLAETLPGKLPQRKLAQTAAAGYSSYGNQIGLATGHVAELYHEGYIAKRLECGAVVAAAPANNVVRERPAPGDVVILLGGRTGRDGIGGATGSSKSHDLKSLTTMASEVQKGNAPEERKIQRLFRNGEVTRLIKRCNDFGAGGVSVAIGELADGLAIELDAVRKKYEGLDGTELAISESQERMSVVVAPEDAEAFIAAATAENLEAYQVAVVTESPRMVMTWNGKVIADLSRAFLNTNGTVKRTDVYVPQLPGKAEVGDTSDVAGRFDAIVKNPNLASQRGLGERFDASIGAGSILFPYGGKKQLTPAQAMVGLIPVGPGRKTDTCSIMAAGFDPYRMERNPFTGARSSVIESVAKVVAAGGDASKVYLSLQEYFERLRDEPARWGKPFAALLGAYQAQIGLGVAAIGGKDSMSGSFLDLDVPPTLVSFAIAPGQTGDVISPEFKAAGHPVYLFQAPDGDYEALKATWAQFHQLVKAGKVAAAWAVTVGGVAEAVMKMSFGNGVGFAGTPDLSGDLLFGDLCGCIVAELTEDTDAALKIGTTTDDGKLTVAGVTLSVADLAEKWEATLEGVYPTHASEKPAEIPNLDYDRRLLTVVKNRVAHPKAVIPVFPGTNCEYDTANACIRAGIDPEILVIRNLTTDLLNQSAQALEAAISQAQMIVLPGGFSGGDEPEGSGKFIASFFRNPRIKDAVHEMLKQRDGLMLGICNGFQALIKLGLVPYGEIRDMDDSCPTLTFNLIGRHQSRYCDIRVASVLSPWMLKAQVGDIYTVPISHGEGRFVAPQAILDEMIQNGQIATQYVDANGVPSMDIAANPNGSIYAIEGIFSPDGRIFGKMGHTERWNPGVAKNIPGEKLMPLFESGAEYFR